MLNLGSTCLIVKDIQKSIVFFKKIIRDESIGAKI